MPDDCTTPAGDGTDHYERSVGTCALDVDAM